MKKRFFVPLTFLLALATLVTACGPTVEPTPTIDPGVVMTQVAETVAAEFTANALLTPSPTATMAPTATLPPTPTQDLTAVTAIPTTAPATQPGAVNPPTAGGDNSIWVQDVTVPDGTVFYTNEYLTKIWRVRNTGTTTWTTDYQLVNIDDNTWGEDVMIPLTVTVEPGQEVDLRVTMRAPSTLGDHISRWFLMNPSGQYFGQELYVYIKVGTEADKTRTPTPIG
ncbi:MAG: hypothetical protein PWQ55_2528 [Chloroflexota bacterium]|nr:hypothetical protein [Chloroflexota bacterium]